MRNPGSPTVRQQLDTREFVFEDPYSTTILGQTRRSVAHSDVARLGAICGAWVSHIPDERIAGKSRWSVAKPATVADCIVPARVSRRLSEQCTTTSIR
jgi:hypothetical protein